MFATKTTQPDYNKIRNDNSSIIANHIKSKLGDKWMKIKTAKAGDKRLDSVLIYLFHSNNRIITPTSYNYQSLGTVDKRSKFIIDFLDKTVDNIDKLTYSDKNFAIFSYERVLDNLFESQHSVNFDQIKLDGYRPANRSLFKTFTINESFDDMELEFD